MSDRTFLGNTKAALVLAAIVAGSAQPAGIAPAPAQQAAVHGVTAPASGTRGQAPTGTQTQRTAAQPMTEDKKKYQARNRLRRARKWMIARGFPASGRQWNDFRKFANRHEVGRRALNIALRAANR